MVRKNTVRNAARGSSKPRAEGTQSGSDAGANSGGDASAEFDADAVQARIDAGESIDAIAASFGTTARGIRHRITRAATRRNRLGTARAALGLEDAEGAPAAQATAGRQEPPAPAGEAPRQLTPEEERALADFQRFCTPRAIVDTVDGFQSSLTSGICYLANVELDERQRALIPFEEAEKKGLEPWAAFATAGLSEEIRKDPSLGLKAFLVILGLTISRRAIMVAAVIKSSNARKAQKHHVQQSAPQAPVPVDAGPSAP